MEARQKGLLLNEPWTTRHKHSSQGEGKAASKVGRAVELVRTQGPLAAEDGSSSASQRLSAGISDLPIAVSWLCPACTTSPLVSGCLGDPGDTEGGHACDTVIIAFFNLPTVHHILDAGDGQGRFSHVSGHHAQSCPLWRRFENLNRWGGQARQHKNLVKI